MSKEEAGKAPKRLRRRALKWGLRIAGFLLALLLIPLGLLAFPQILLSNEVREGSVIIHYRGPADPSISALAQAVDHRLRAGGFGNPDDPKDGFLFREHGLYAFFARLARVPSQAQGFGLSALGNAFVSEPQVRALGERTGRNPPFSVWEGSAAHTMAHEIAHIILIDSIGRKRWVALPHWKQEGFPEYIANVGLLRAEAAPSLRGRVAVLLDESQWSGPRGWDRIHYEAGLMVEYLLEVRGMGFREALDAAVTRDQAYREMVGWSRAETSSESDLPASQRPDP